MEFLHWLEQTGVSTWVRESDSIWAYPGIITLHAAGLAVMVGLSTVISLRILGFVPGVPLAALEKLYPMIWLGFCVNAVSGVLLIVSDPVTMLSKTLFLIKMVLIASAVVNLVLIRRWVFGPQAPRAGIWRARALAITSIVLWIAATTAGRLTAYLETTTV
jgi:hypothetical protein